MAAGTEDTIAIPYLFLVLGFLPMAGFLSWDYLRRNRVIPKKKRYSVAIWTQIFLLAFTLLVAREEDVDLFPAIFPSAAASIVGLLFLVGLLRYVHLRWRRLQGESRQKLSMFLPTTQREFWFWIAVSLLAGVGEECAYRGAAYKVLVLLSQSPRFTLVVCVVAFAIAHLYQGWKAAFQIGLLGLLSHFAVFLTGSLYLSIGVHSIYDLCLGWLAVRLHADVGLQEAEAS